MQMGAVVSRLLTGQGALLMIDKTTGLVGSDPSTDNDLGGLLTRTAPPVHARPGPTLQKRVHFLLPGVNQLSDLLVTNLASTRLRLAVAASALEEVSSVKVTVGESPRTISPDAVVVGKIGAYQVDNRASQWIRYLTESKASGSKIIVDYTDHHLGFGSEMSQFYETCVGLADLIVVPSKEMRSNLKGTVSCPIKLIHDAVEYECVKPKKFSCFNAIWFGHATNINFLIDFLRKTELPKVIASLCICTDTKSIDALKGMLDSRSKLTITFTPWSVRNLRNALLQSDFAIIPVGCNDKRKSGAGANRLLTSLCHGTPVFTQELNSYLPYRDYFLDLDQDLPNLNHNLVEQGKQKALAAQTDVLPFFHPSQLKSIWKVVIGDLIGLTPIAGGETRHG